MDTQEQKIEPTDEDSKMLAALGYIFGFFVALIIFLVKKEDKFVKFHTKQEILFDIEVLVITVVASVLVFAVAAVLVLSGVLGSLGVGATRSSALGLGVVGTFMGGYLGIIAWYGVILLITGIALLIRLFMAYRAFKGKATKLPIIGKYAARGL